MALTFRKLHPTFVAEARGVQLRTLTDPKVLAEIRAGMDEYAVLVFPEQPFTDEEHLAFAQALDGALHQRTGARVLAWEDCFDGKSVSELCFRGLDARCRGRG